jgi:hypothetical protein
MEVYTPDARLTAALQEISDTLTAEGLHHLMEPTDENPLCYAVTCYDGYRMNSGFVGIGADDTVSFAAYDPVRGRHDEMEGVPDEDSKCWWRPNSVSMTVWFLNGSVAELMNDVRRDASVDDAPENRGTTQNGLDMDSTR